MDIENGEINTENNHESSQENGTKTKLVYHPDWELSIQEKYVFQYHHQRLPILDPNQIKIQGVNLYEFDNDIVVTALLSNSLSRPFQFEMIDLAVVDEQNEILARKTFEMDLFGEMEPHTTTPWRFLFTKEHQLVEQIPKKGWKLIFDLQQKESQELILDLEENWEKELNDEQKNHLINIVHSLPPLQKGEVNFLGLQAALNEENGITITLLIRSAQEKSLFIESLPLVLEDSSGEIVAKSGFPIGNIEIKPFTCKALNFTFTSESILKEEIDLSAWKVYVPQQ